jgi:hypothetical protein
MGLRRRDLELGAFLYEVIESSDYGYDVHQQE